MQLAPVQGIRKFKSFCIEPAVLLDSGTNSHKAFAISKCRSLHLHKLETSYSRTPQNCIAINRFIEQSMLYLNYSNRIAMCALYDTNQDKVRISLLRHD